MKQRLSDDDGDAPPGAAAGERRPLLAAGGGGSEVVISIGGPGDAPPPVIAQQCTGGSGGAPAATVSSELAAAGGGEDGWPRQCRICFDSEEGPGDGDPANPLISPCLCRGGSRYVHRQCLAQWRTSNTRHDAAWQCEVCKFKYRYARAWWAGLLGSPALLAFVFAGLLALMVYALGFIPLLSNGTPDAGGDAGPALSPGLLHAAQGVVALGILGLTLSMALGILRALGMAPAWWLLLPDPWCPTALCLDCQGGGLPLACMEVSSAGECGVLLAAFFGVALLVLGVVASCVLVYHLLLAATSTALGHAQQMVENIGDTPMARSGSLGAGGKQRRRGDSRSSSSGDDAEAPASARRGGAAAAAPG